MTKSVFFAFLLIIIQFIGHPELRAQCTNCANSYMNATDPGTIEYDNIVSTFHSSMARLSDGSVMGWGQYIKKDGDSHSLIPIEINSDNYPGLTGDILKFTGGSSANPNAQFIILTTDGLFAWGKRGTVLDNALTTDNTFQKISLGLPSVVSPADVKMLFGTHRTLAITTCSGDVYVLSQKPAMRGNGGSGTNTTWYRVTEAGTGFPNLSNVVAVRGSASALMALKDDGTIWTWGPDTYLGDGTARASRTRATQMTLPSGVTPKMIGATTTSSGSRTSYFILGTDKYVYSLGNNSGQILGDQTTTERTSWVQVKSGPGENDFLSNIVWISPMEHDGFNYGAVNAITANRELWTWGNNQNRMIGGGTPATISPTMNPGGLTSADKIIAVETGGHTSMTLKECSSKYGYVGHRINGSMGDGSDADALEETYNFDDTPALPVCGANTGAPALYPPDGAVKVGEAKQLTYSPAGGLFEIVSGNASITQDGVLTANSNAEDIIVRYTITEGNCGPQSTEMIIAAEDIALPATFSNVAAVIRNGRLQINFTTLTERDNDHFEIQASKDGKKFVTIGILKSKAENGQSNSPLNYEFASDWSSAVGLLAMFIAGIGLIAFRTHPSRSFFLLALLVGGSLFLSSCRQQEITTGDADAQLFIRIKQVDKDGKSSYSKVIKTVGE